MWKKLLGENSSPGLTSKILLPLLLGWLLFLVLAALVVRQSVTRLVYSIYNQNLSSASSTIETSIEHAMYTNDFHFVQQVVQSISSQERVGVIRVLDNQGKIVASSLPEETGVILPSDATWCRECHTSTSAARPTIRRMQANTNPEPVMVVAYRIENQIACQSCHSVDQASLGVILTEFPTTLVDNQLKLLDQALATGVIGMLVVVLALSAFIVNRQVARPLHRLAMPGGSLPAGDYPYEVETLSQRLESLEADLQRQEEQLALQRRNFDALLSLSESTGGVLSIRQVFQQALQTILQLTGYDTVAMRQYDQQRHCFRLVVQVGMSSEMVDELACVPDDKGYLEELRQLKKPVFTRDLGGDKRSFFHSPIDIGFHSVTFVPLLGAGDLVGSMELATKEEYIPNEEELRWLSLVGRSIGLLVYQVQTTERLRDLTILQERSRIAQEIHDGLAQLIGSLRIWAEEAHRSLSENNLTAVQSAIERIETTARDAYNSLREEMLGLRDTVTPGKDFLAVLGEYLSRFKRQWGIETHLLMDREQVNEVFDRLPPHAEIQLLRIIQETYTNVRRHAAATRIQVAMEARDGWLVVEIRDNGQGFDPQKVGEDRLGLRIMRERAASLGGHIQITSRPTQGTTLRVELPLPEIIRSLEKNS